MDYFNEQLYYEIDAFVLSLLLMQNTKQLLCSQKRKNFKKIPIKTPSFIHAFVGSQKARGKEFVSSWFGTSFTQCVKPKICFMIGLIWEYEKSADFPLHFQEAKAQFKLPKQICMQFFLQILWTSSCCLFVRSFPIANKSSNVWVVPFSRWPASFSPRAVWLC